MVGYRKPLLLVLLLLVVAGLIVGIVLVVPKGDKDGKKEGGGKPGEEKGGKKPAEGTPSAVLPAAGEAGEEAATSQTNLAGAQQGKGGATPKPAGDQQGDAATLDLPAHKPFVGPVFVEKFLLPVKCNAKFHTALHGVNVFFDGVKGETAVSGTWLKHFGGDAAKVKELVTANDGKVKDLLKKLHKYGADVKPAVVETGKVTEHNVEETLLLLPCNLALVLHAVNELKELNSRWAAGKRFGKLAQGAPVDEDDDAEDEAPVVAAAAAAVATSASAGTGVVGEAATAGQGVGTGGVAGVAAPGGGEAVGGVAGVGNVGAVSQGADAGQAAGGVAGTGSGGAGGVGTVDAASGVAAGQGVGTGGVAGPAGAPGGVGAVATGSGVGVGAAAPGGVASAKAAGEGLDPRDWDASAGLVETSKALSKPLHELVSLVAKHSPFGVPKSAENFKNALQWTFYFTLSTNPDGKPNTEFEEWKFNFEKWLAARVKVLGDADNDVKVLKEGLDLLLKKVEDEASKPAAATGVTPPSVGRKLVGVEYAPKTQANANTVEGKVHKLVEGVFTAVHQLPLLVASVVGEDALGVKKPVQTVQGAQVAQGGQVNPGTQPPQVQPGAGAQVAHVELHKRTLCPHLLPVFWETLAEFLETFKKEAGPLLAGVDLKNQQQQAQKQEALVQVVKLVHKLVGVSAKSATFYKSLDEAETLFNAADLLVHALKLLQPFLNTWKNEKLGLAVPVVDPKTPTVHRSAAVVLDTGDAATTVAKGQEGHGAGHQQPANKAAHAHA